MVKFEARAKVLLKFVFSEFSLLRIVHIFFFNKCRGAELENLRLGKSFKVEPFLY